MKTVCWFLFLGIQAMGAVAQTASAPLQIAAGTSTLGNGTTKFEDRIKGGAAHSLFESPDAPSDSLPQLAVNLAVADDSELFLSVSQKLPYGSFADGDIPSFPSTDLPHSEDSSSTSILAIRPVEPPHPDTRIHWKAANGEALLSTGIMHTFNLWTEAGTRDALYGPWAKDWLQSVSELRGWSDSDRFMAPYVGHSIQGSIFGYILRQNDPKYRDVQWGDGRDYFMNTS